MATYTFKSELFPEGTQIKACPAGAIPAGHSGPPLGPAADTQTVTNGQVTFTGLTEGERYLAAGQVNGAWRYVGFSLDITTGEKWVVFHGANADASRPDVASVEWIGSVEPNNAEDGDTLLLYTP